jgi:hypothetical protein
VAPKLRADDDDADDLRDLLAAREGLGHLRIRRRADLLTLQSGDEADPISHARFRRASVHNWTLECATHTGRWERTGFRDTLPKLVDLLVTALPWTIAPID